MRAALLFERATSWSRRLDSGTARGGVRCHSRQLCPMSLYGQRAALTRSRLRLVVSTSESFLCGFIGRISRGTTAHCYTRGPGSHLYGPLDFKTLAAEPLWCSRLTILFSVQRSSVEKLHGAVARRARPAMRWSRCVDDDARWTERVQYAHTLTFIFALSPTA